MLILALSKLLDEMYFLNLLLYSLLLLPSFFTEHAVEPSPDSSAGDIDTQQTAYKVIGVKDGDTFAVLMNGREQVVRLEHIDCPEKKQPFGAKAREFISEQCFGKYVTLIHRNKYDRNKRLIAEVILPDGSNLNKMLVKNGLAWHFKKYSNSNEYAQLEAMARKNRTGLWSEPAPTAPWNWRTPKKKKKEKPVTVIHEKLSARAFTRLNVVQAETGCHG